MKYPPNKTNRIVEIFRKQPLFLGKAKKDVSVMNFLRGNIDSKTLCIAPPPSEQEYENNLPLSDASAREFHNILAVNGVNTEKDMLVVSCSRFGPKANKHSCTPIVDFIGQCVRLNQFRLYVCIGDAAFKHIFAYGRKANMPTLIGNIVYLKQLNHLPLFTFPSLDGLIVPDDAMPTTKRWGAKMTERMHQIAKEFSKIKKNFVK